VTGINIQPPCGVWQQNPEFGSAFNRSTQDVQRDYETQATNVQLDEEGSRTRESVRNLSYLEKCYRSDNYACVTAGLAYERSRDFERAINVYKLACDNDHAAACYFLASLYRSNSQADDAENLAHRYSRKACDLGDADGCGTLGLTYILGIGTEVNRSKGLSIYLKGCDARNYSSCEIAGTLLISDDPEMAIQLYRKACLNQYTQSCVTWGKAVRDGPWVERDLKEAFDLFLFACQKESEEGCFELGKAYYHGKGVSKNSTLAYEAYAESCELGDSVASYGCQFEALAYMNGEGTATNLEIGLEMLEDICEEDANAVVCERLQNTR
jgi:TPR repeat protein